MDKLDSAIERKRRDVDHLKNKQRREVEEIKDKHRLALAVAETELRSLEQAASLRPSKPEGGSARAASSGSTTEPQLKGAHRGKLKGAPRKIRSS
jgi:hypothetical protein